MILNQAGHILDFSYFLVASKHKVKLITFEWWTEKLCNEIQLVTLNVFDKKSMKWKNPLEIKEKYRNFHGCILVSRKEVPYRHSRYDLKEKVVFGLLPEVEELAAQIGNFSVIFQLYRLVGGIPIELLDDVDLIPNYEIISCGLMVRYGVHMTSPFEDFGIIFVITPGEKYSSYEKLSLPFDDETWKYLAITFGLAFGVVFVINHLPKTIQNLVYGKRVTMPSYNIIGSFFGISQKTLPKQNFSRFLLIFFVMFCLIFRVAYQGVFFEMMTTDMRKKLPQSFYEFKEKNFTIVAMQPVHVRLLNKIDVDNKTRPNIVTVRNMRITYESHIDTPSPRLAFFMEQNYYDFVRNETRKDGIVLSERLFTFLRGFGLPRDHFLYYCIEEAMRRLIPNGIATKLYNYDLYKFQDSLKEGPKVLTVDDLRFGFIIWLVACGISSLMFMSEVIWIWSKNLAIKIMRICVGLILFLKLLSERLQRHQGH